MTHITKPGITGTGEPCPDNDKAAPGWTPGSGLPTTHDSDFKPVSATQATAGTPSQIARETINVKVDKADNYVITLPIVSIKVANRFRQDLGDIAPLAASIKDLGLLQPIGVDQDYNLIFGQRRLEAHKALGLDTIKARLIRVASLFQAEYAENEIRKDFTPSERVAIGKAIEEEIGNRQGQRTDKTSYGLSVNLPEVNGRKTADIAAEQAGFGSEKTYRDAKTVVAQAEPELVEAMDKGEIAISTAAKLSKADPETQRQASADPKVAPLLAKPAVPAPKDLTGYLTSHGNAVSHLAKVTRDLRSKVSTSSGTPLASVLEDLIDIRDSTTKLIASLEKLAVKGGGQ